MEGGRKEKRQRTEELERTGRSSRVQKRSTRERGGREQTRRVAEKLRNNERDK